MLDIQKFLDTVSCSAWYKKIAEDFAGRFYGKHPDLQEIEDFIAEKNPRSVSAVYSIISMLNQYAKYISDDSLAETISQIDKQAVLQKCSKVFVYVTQEQADKYYRELKYLMSLNGLFYAVLFRVFYEGLFAANNTDLVELRIKDIYEEGVVVSRRYERLMIQCSDFLKEEMARLAEVGEWYHFLRETDTVICRDIIGKYPDSVFKYYNEAQKESFDENLSLSNIRKWKTLTQEIGISSKPRDIFHSGIINRVTAKSQLEGLDISDFLHKNRSHSGSQRISEILIEELQRVGDPSFLDPDKLSNKLYVNKQIFRYKQIFKKYFEP